VIWVTVVYLGIMVYTLTMRSTCFIGISKRFALCAAAASAFLAAPSAFGQSPPPAPNRPFGVAPDVPAAPSNAVRLEYAAPDGCPDERELRSIVGAHMGYDPFTSASGPANVVRTRVVHQGGGFVGTVELRDPAGRVLWARPPLADPDCRRLVSVLGGVSIRAAIDTAPSTPAPPAPPPPVVQPPVPPALPPPPPPSASAIPVPALRLGARGGVAFGTLPGPAAAFSADIGAGWRLFSVNLEGVATLPVERDVDSGVRLRSSLLAGSIVPCGHYGWFVGCGVLSLGAMRAEGVNLTSAAHSTGVYVAAGLRAALEWPIVPAFALRLSADALVNLHPLAPQFRVGATEADAKPVEVWRSGPFAAMLGAGIVARFGGGSRPAGAPSGPAVGEKTGRGRF